ncbi:MAG: hypothetical protein VB047_02840 [Anaerotignum propionicum]|uniref:hypothetical protein n=1 Tax=Anaerotignum propionicum TaxID=28446 RepID=UPI002B20886A|nr:hypothetical protein [Anaerotignum propionicum]MEA5056478.1 hypothetical protein [Anaerotignum propionicum]
MYHNPNLPYPFSSRTCGRPIHRRPTPVSDWGNIPTAYPNCKELPVCREQPFCEEKPICKKQPVCEEKPVCMEKPQVKNCQPQPLNKVCENPRCDNIVTENVLTCANSCNNSCCNGNQLIFLLVILFLFGMN